MLLLECYDEYIEKWSIPCVEYDAHWVADDSVELLT